MNLKGGLDMYRMGKRYADGEPPKGRKVMFLDKNGYDRELEHARELFKYGDILTVKEIYVGSWSSDVEFEEYPDMKFNTVMFSDVEEDVSDWLEQQHMSYTCSVCKKVIKPIMHIEDDKVMLKTTTNDIRGGIGNKKILDKICDECCEKLKLWR